MRAGRYVASEDETGGRMGQREMKRGKRSLRQRFCAGDNREAERKSLDQRFGALRTGGFFCRGCGLEVGLRRR